MREHTGSEGKVEEQSTFCVCCSHATRFINASRNTGVAVAVHSGRHHRNAGFWLRSHHVYARRFHTSAWNLLIVTGICLRDPCSRDNASQEWHRAQVVARSARYIDSLRNRLDSLYFALDASLGALPQRTIRTFRARQTRRSTHISHIGFATAR